MTRDPVATLLYVFVILAWWGFAGLFLRRRRGPKAAETKRDHGSIAGIALQGLAFFLVWFRPLGRAPTSPLTATQGVSIALAVLAALLVVGSIALVAASVRTLGRHWALAARLVEGHRLVTAGPYGRIRNPIYTGMLGMLLATGIATTHPATLLAAVAVFLAGTAVRVNREGRLLRAAFPEEFEAYARAVPPLVPRLSRRPTAGGVR